MNPENISRRQILGATLLGAAALASVAYAQDGAMTPKNDALKDAAMTPPPMETPALAPSFTPGDFQLLGTALRVEQLRANFFSQVLAAHANRAFLTPRALEIMRMISTNANTHVSAISGVLTGNGATAPAATFKYSPNSLISPIGAAWTGYTVTEIAIGSHLNALENLDSKDLRATVVGIIGANSRNAALLRALSGFSFAPRYFESQFSPSQVENLLARYA